MALRLRLVKMKNILYLLIPMSISELLDIDQSRELMLTTETSHGQLLKYAFSRKIRVNDLEQEERRGDDLFSSPPQLSHVSP